MIYEQTMINGILHYRNDPDEEWKPRQLKTFTPPSQQPTYSEFVQIGYEEIELDTTPVYQMEIQNIL